VKPWKTRPLTAGRWLELMLQFGHGGEAVEDKLAERGKVLVIQCFNSATAVKPWKTPIPVFVRAFNVQLQFGHGGEAVED